MSSLYLRHAYGPHHTVVYPRLRDNNNRERIIWSSEDIQLLYQIPNIQEIFFLLVGADSFNDKAKSEKISDKQSVDR